MAAQDPQQQQGTSQGTSQGTPVVHPSGSTLQRGRIAVALRGAPTLGKESLVERRDGRTCARCAMGQLLVSLGVSDIVLARIDRSGLGGIDLDVFLWKQYGPLLEVRFGFQSARQLGAVMDANDSASDGARDQVVLNEIDRMVQSGWR